MFRYNSRKAMLSAAVAISTIVVSAAVDKSAMAEEITYTGTQDEYGALVPSNTLMPNASQSGNSIKISDPESLGADYQAPGSVYGGFTMDDDTEIKNNQVLVEGGQAGNVVGGYSLTESEAIVTGNSVLVSGGTVGDIYGGGVQNSGTGDITVTNNTVTLDGDFVRGSVYGGYATDANGNLITDFNKVISGNTLNLNGYKGTVAGIHNSENYNWVLPKNVVNDDTLIHITGDAVNLNQTRHTIAMENDGNRLNAGDKIVMIDKATGTPVAVPTEVTQGQFLVYDVDVKVVDDKFVLSVADKDDATPEPTPTPTPTPAGRINERSKAFSEGRAAALGFVNQDSDLIATTGIDSIRMMEHSKDKNVSGSSFAPFIAMNGSSLRYKTGSHVDVDGFNMALGLASGIETKAGHKVTLGAFFEHGRGTYNSYNSFANSASVKGGGDTDYTGVGVLGRVDIAGTGLGRAANLAPDQTDGLYIEGSLRAGKAKSDFSSSDLIDEQGRAGAYNSKADYYGGHAAVGYVFNVDDRQALDVYGRYLWTHMDGDTVSVGKDTLHFDSSTSSRMQIGGRYSYTYSDQFKPYIGVAYEREFSGDIGATAYGMNLDKPSLKGSTGIVEAGFTFTPNANNRNLSINLNASAFVGQRQGGAGGIKLNYQF